MEQKTFWIISGQSHSTGDIIYSRESRLRIRVCRTDDYNYSPNPYEIQLYCCINNEVLVFETISIQPKNAQDMAAAIQWYAAYHGNPGIMIFTQEPNIEYNYLHGRSQRL